MKALRGKRKYSEQKSHTAPPAFLLATPIYGLSHDTQKTAVAEGSHTRWGGFIWTWNLLMEIIIWWYTGNRSVGGRE